MKERWVGGENTIPRWGCQASEMTIACKRQSAAHERFKSLCWHGKPSREGHGSLPGLRPHAESHHGKELVSSPIQRVNCHPSVGSRRGNGMEASLPQGVVVMLLIRREQDCLAITVLLAETPLPVAASLQEVQHILSG